MRRLIGLVITTLFLVNFASAQEAQSSFNREVTIKVNGAVCGFCSYGVRKELYKLPFVDASRFEKGIRTNSEEQSVTIAILPEGKVDEEKLKEIVTDAGYETLAIEHNDK